jgi:hypothetical protein
VEERERWMLWGGVRKLWSSSNVRCFLRQSFRQLKSLMFMSSAKNCRLRARLICLLSVCSRLSNSFVCKIHPAYLLALCILFAQPGVGKWESYGNAVVFHMVPYFEECSPGVASANCEFIFENFMEHFFFFF